MRCDGLEAAVSESARGAKWTFTSGVHYVRFAPHPEIAQTKPPAHRLGLRGCELRAQAAGSAFRFRRHQPSKPPPAMIRPAGQHQQSDRGGGKH